MELTHKQAKPAALILYASISGNTRFVAMQMLQNFYKRLGFQVVLLDITTPRSRDPELLHRQIAAKMPFKTVGIGSPVMSRHIPGFMLDTVRGLPHGLASSSFTFTTFSDQPGPATFDLATALEESTGAPSACYLELKTPDSFQPKPNPKAWAGALDALSDFFNNFRRHIFAAEKGKRTMPPRRNIQRVLYRHPTYEALRARLPKPQIVDPAGCYHCHLCENSCPMGAITLVEEGTVRLEVTDDCFRCCGCANGCPKGVIALGSREGQYQFDISAITASLDSQ